MQGVLRPRLRLFSGAFISPQSASYHRSSTTRRLKTMSYPSFPGFFPGSSLSHRAQSAFHHGMIRRAFATARGGDSFPAYTSSRQAMRIIVGLNTAVFGAWLYAMGNKDQSLLNKLSRNFTVSLQNIKEGRYYTTLTAAFSHQLLPHFAFNMISFYAFGTILSVMGIGPAHLSTICVGSAIAGSLGILYHWKYNTSGRADEFRRGLGASGMVMGAGAAATCLAPFAPMQVMFIPINIPLWVLTVAYAAIDAYYLNSKSPIGHAAHLGGSVFGVVYYFVFLRRFGGVSDLLRVAGGRGRWR